MMLRTLVRAWLCLALLFVAPVWSGDELEAAPPVRPAAEPQLAGLVKITAGAAHTCGVAAAGALYCWGRNFSGQLGDGTLTERGAPEPNPYLTAGVTAVAAGATFTCAVVNGGAQCWGTGASGQLGAGLSITRSTAPVGVSGLAAGVLDLAAGEAHVCALLTGGAVKCWGRNDKGQLGDDQQYTNAFTPVQVVGLTSGVTAIVSKFDHTCALLGGGLQCWGDNFNHQLGAGDNHFSVAHPLPVVGLASGVTAAATGEVHSCAIQSGAVLCWGGNFFGQLGTGNTASYETPVASAIASGATGLAGGYGFTCAVVSGGAARCWGEVTGDGTLNRSLTARDVVGLNSAVTALAAGYQHACALHAGSIVCWGSNADGQLGSGVPDVHTSPVPVVGLASGAQQVAAGSGFACALTGAGGVKCWGDNQIGQINRDPSTTSLSATPVAVAGLTSHTSLLAAGDRFACAVAAVGGAVRCWGDGTYGQLGNGLLSYSSFVPVTVTGLSGVTLLRAGLLEVCAIAAGALKCWGNFHSTPIAVSGLGGSPLDVASGGSSTCAVIVGGAVKCWGDNTYGQLGVGNHLAGSSVPTNVVGLSSGVTGVAVGAFNACALLASGHVKCWGDNHFGQIGDGTYLERDAPVDVPGLSGVTALTARGGQVCARLSAGSVQCWGQVLTGYRTIEYSSDYVTAPRNVPGLGSGVAAASAGFYHDCALTTGGAVKCWGVNSRGELGNGEAAVSVKPVNTAAPITLTLSYTYLPLIRR